MATRATTPLGRCEYRLTDHAALMATALRLVLGFLRPTSVKGHDCGHDSVAVRRLVAYLPGELRLYENMTGRQIIRFLGQLRGVQPDSEVDALAKTFDIDRPGQPLLRHET